MSLQMHRPTPPLPTLVEPFLKPLVSTPPFTSTQQQQPSDYSTTTTTQQVAPSESDIFDLVRSQRTVQRRLSRRNAVQSQQHSHTSSSSSSDPSPLLRCTASIESEFSSSEDSIKRNSNHSGNESVLSPNAIERLRMLSVNTTAPSLHINRTASICSSNSVSSTATTVVSTPSATSPSNNSGMRSFSISSESCLPSPSELNRSLLRSEMAQLDIDGSTVDSSLLLRLKQELMVLKSHIAIMNEERKRNQHIQQQVISQLKAEIQTLKLQSNKQHSSNTSDSDEDETTTANETESEASENEGSVMHHAKHNRQSKSLKSSPQQQHHFTHKPMKRYPFPNLRMHLDEAHVETIVNNPTTPIDSESGYSEDERHRTPRDNVAKFVVTCDVALQCDESMTRLRFIDTTRLVDKSTGTEGELLTHKQTQTERKDRDMSVQTDHMQHSVEIQTDSDSTAAPQTLFVKPHIDAQTDSEPTTAVASQQQQDQLLAELRHQLSDKVAHTELLRVKLLETEKQCWQLHGRLTKIQEQHSSLLQHVSEEYNDDPFIESLLKKQPRQNAVPDQTKRLTELLTQIATQEHQLALFEKSQLELEQCMAEKNRQIVQLDEALFRVEEQVAKQEKMLNEKQREYEELKTELEQILQLKEELQQRLNTAEQQIQLHTQLAQQQQQQQQRQRQQQRQQQLLQQVKQGEFDSRTGSPGAHSTPSKSHSPRKAHSTTRSPTTLQYQQATELSIHSPTSLFSSLPRREGELDTALHTYLSSPQISRLPQGQKIDLQRFASFTQQPQQQQRQPQPMVKTASFDHLPVGSPSRLQQLQQQQKDRQQDEEELCEEEQNHRGNNAANNSTTNIQTQQQQQQQNQQHQSQLAQPTQQHPKQPISSSSILSETENSKVQSNSNASVERTTSSEFAASKSDSVRLRFASDDSNDGFAFDLVDTTQSVKPEEFTKTI